MKILPSNIGKHLLMIVSVTVLSYLAAHVGLQTRLQPMDISVVWLQAGFALAAMLLFGGFAGVGIFAGSLLFSLGQMSGDNGPWVSMAAAVGSSLQAWLAAYLLARIIKAQLPQSVKEIIQSIGVLVASAWIAPLFSLLAACAAGYQAWSNFPSHLWTGWIGSSIGVLTLTPLLVALYLKFVRKTKNKELLLWPLAGILVGLSLFSFFAILNNGEHTKQDKITSDFSEISSVLREAVLIHDTQSIVAIRSFFDASQAVDRNEFKAFTSAFLAEYPNTLALTWAPRVLDQDREAFEQSVRDEGFSDFTIYEKDRESNHFKASRRSEYFVVDYIEPFESNLAMLGFDNGSEADRLQVIELARDSGQAVFSQPLTLFQNNQPDTGILMVIPIYQNGKPIDTLEQRRANLAGVAVGAFNAKSLVATALREIEHKDLSLYIYDISSGSVPQFLAFYSTYSPQQSMPAPDVLQPGSILDGVTRSTILDIGNRKWQVIALPGSSYDAFSDVWTAWASLLGGLTLTAAFLAYNYNRQKTETVLARSEAEFRSLSEYALTGIIRFKRTGEILYANQALTQMFGFSSAAEFMRKSIFEHVNQPQSFESPVRALPPDAQLTNQEMSIIRQDGKVCHLLFAASVHQDVISATVNDITERIKNAQAIRQLSHVVTQAADAVVITDLSGNIEYVNPAFEKNTSFSLEELMGKTPRVIKSGAHPKEFYESLWSTILQGEVFEAEFQNCKKNGEIFYEIKTISPIRNDQGIITHFAATGKDITDRKLAEAALKVEQDRNQALITNATDGIVVLGPEKKFTYASPTACKLFGFAEEDIGLLNPVALTHPDDLGLVMQTLGIVRADATRIITIQYRTRSNSGEWFWIESTYRNMNNDPAIGGIVINFRDITERKVAEDKLKKSEHQNRTLVEAIPDLLFRMKRDGTFVDYKAPANIPLTSPPGQFVGLKITHVMPADIAGQCMDAIEQAFNSNRPVSYQYQLMEDELHIYEARVVASREDQEVVLIVRDVTEERKLQDSISASEERYRQLSEALEEKVKEGTAKVRDLYDNAPTGYHSLDQNGVYQMINQTELNWFGYTQDEMIGKMHTTDLMTPESVKDFKGIYPIFLERGLVKDVEFNYVRKNGSILPVLLNATAIYDQDGNFVMSRATVFDNTERKKVQEALQKSRDDLSLANAALAKASKLKDEFLASMSHELRTPLTGILGLSEALQMETYGHLNDRQAFALENIESSGRHLLELINDILDLSKIEADKLELQLEQCSLADICQASLQLTKGMAHQKHQMVNFTTNIPNAMVLADPRRFKQMLVNLLSNSIKFTPDSGQLGLEVAGSEEEQVIRFTVWDKGAGIKSEDLGKLFKPFTQLDTSLSRQHSGTGLGLSLVSRLAEMHGGSVSVESAFRGGSRFTITLPWAVQSATLPVKGEVEPLKILKRCMIVEDVEIQLKQIGDYLQRLGVEYIPSRLGQGAVDLAVSYNPDVILLDLGLPDISGGDVLVRLKNDPRTTHIPVIISSVEEDQKHYKDLGASGYLVKPFSIDRLKAELMKISKVEPGFETTEGVDLGPIQVLMADDNPLILDTLADFLRSQSFNVITAKDGWQLLDLVEQVKPDIILTDIQMPGLDGLTAIREIRRFSDPALANLPIVAITALAMPGDREMCLSAGANEYISKPVKLDRLAKVVKDIVVGFRRKQLSLGNF